jgi:hypothetical protein
MRRWPQLLFSRAKRRMSCLTVGAVEGRPGRRWCWANVHGGGSSVPRRRRGLVPGNTVDAVPDSVAEPLPFQDHSAQRLHQTPEVRPRCIGVATRACSADAAALPHGAGQGSRLVSVGAAHPVPLVHAEPLGFEDLPTEFFNPGVKCKARDRRVESGARPADSATLLPGVGVRGGLMALGTADAVPDAGAKPLGFEDLALERALAFDRNCSPSSTRPPGSSPWTLPHTLVSPLNGSRVIRDRVHPHFATDSLDTPRGPEPPGTRTEKPPGPHPPAPCQTPHLQLRLQLDQEGQTHAECRDHHLHRPTRRSPTPTRLTSRH